MSVLEPKANTTLAFTDGACKGNPGPGGWGVLIITSNGEHSEFCGGDDLTTNNKMELMGAIVALEKSNPDEHLEIWTDSSYVKNGITSWIEGWKKKGWKTASKKPVKNQELWQRLDALQRNRSVSWHWVKGHAGHEGNEKADQLANQGIVYASENKPSSSVHQKIIEPANLELDTDNRLKKNWIIPIYITYKNLHMSCLKSMIQLKTSTL